MYIRKIKYKEEEALIIYLTQYENDDNIVKKKIIKYRKEYSNVTVFVSGSKNIENVLKIIVQKRM